MSLSITSLSFDQAVYNPGAVITLTVMYTSTDTAASDITSAVTATVTDAVSTVTSSPATLTVAAAGQAEPTTVTAADNRTPAGTWVLVSNGFTGTGPFTGTAVLTSTA